jgi:PHD/YefM family antitoxin component YafN of YafNO toxin-antitoxin module
MSKSLQSVTISELKQSPSRVIEQAKASAQPVPILRNNQVEGYYVPVNAMALMSVTDQEANTAFEAVLECQGDAIKWLASH